MSPERTDAKIVVELPIEEADPCEEDWITERLPRLHPDDLDADDAADWTVAAPSGARALAED